MTFREITNQDLKIFLFQMLRKPWFWKQREFLNKLCLRQSICIMAFLYRDICIMTYPLEDICISISVRRHLHHGLNACTGIVMNKLCIFIPTWDICIIKNCICIFVKEHLYQKQKSRRASHFSYIHRKIDIWVSVFESVNSMLGHNVCLLHW